MPMVGRQSSVERSRESYAPEGLEHDADSPTEMEVSRIEKPVLSVGWAYVYLVTLGWLGVHRFYLRRWYTGALYAVSFGFLGLGLILDVVLIPFMTKGSNQAIEAQFRANPERFRTWPERVAPWARNAGKFDPQVLLVAVYWLFAPGLLAMLAVMFGFPWGPIYLAVMLAVVAFAGSTQQLVERYPNLGQIPLVSTVVHHLVELEQFYYDHKPRPLIYYLAFPITAPIGAIFSPTARTEARILLWPAGVVLVGLAADFLWSFSDHFKDSIGLEDAVQWIFVIVFCCGLIVTMFLLPTVTTALTLNLSGRRRYTRLFAVIAILIGVPFTIVAYQMFSNRITIPAAELLELRLKNDEFRDSVTEIGQMFLGEHQPSTRAPSDLSNATVEVDEELSEQIQKIFEGFFPDSEVAAFRILRVLHDGQTVLTVLHYDSENDMSEPPDEGDICMRQPFIVADYQDVYTSVADLAKVINIDSVANGVGQGDETYLIDEWPCGTQGDW